MSAPIVTSTDGNKWQIMVTDHTQDKNDSSRVGIREIQIIPYTDGKTPNGFWWHDSTLDQLAGIRIIET